MRYAFVLIALLCITGPAWAQISIPNTSFTYTENFNTLPISGTGHTAVPAGWAFFETSSAFGANTTFRAGDASGAWFEQTYDTYSFGATGNSDRAFGSITSTGQDSLNTTIGACFTNNTGATITSLTITYTGETWQVASQNRVDGLVFQYNQNTTAINGAGTWTAFSALDYFNPGAPTIGGGSLRHSAVVSSTISGLNIAPGNTFCFRWLNFDATAAAQGNPNQEDAIGIDDFSLGNIVACAPPVVNAPTVTQPTCGAPSGGAITVNATGIGVLEYSINNGSTWSTDPMFSGLAAGNYTIKVRLQANQSCETTYGSNPVVLTPPFTVSTTTDTWTGCVSTDWATPGNWADGSVPTAADNATIPNVANDPVIMGSTAALARSVLVQAGAVLTINTMGSLTINNSAVHGLDNYGTVDNSGSIIVGNTTAITAIGIVHRNGGAFNNKPGGVIQIDRTLGAQAFNSTGSVNNEGVIEIGSNAAISNQGIRVDGGTFNNNPGGDITINRTSSIGFRNAATFTNSAILTIGNIAFTGQDDIYNTGSFTNAATGVISVDRAWGNGIWNVSGSFQNSGEITIGSIANTGVGILNTASFSNNGSIQLDRVTRGLTNTSTFNNAGQIRMGNNVALGERGFLNGNGTGTVLAVFNNLAGSLLQIDRTAANRDGITNELLTTFTNAGAVSIGTLGSIGGNGITNAGTFSNSACATLTVFDNLNNSSTFTNAGLFMVNTAQAHTNSALTNNGIIAYPQGNPIPNVTNNEIIIAPTTANACDVISPAFGLGSPVDFTIMGIFTNEAATMSAGTYTTATNTFTPTTLLAEGVRTFYVKITDGTGGCTRIVPWQLTTEDCCDAPQAICKTATIALVGNSASLSVAQVNNGSTADCGLQSISVSPNTFNCSHVSTPQMVTLTVTDVNNNSSTCTTTITVLDNTQPSFACPANRDVNLNATCQLVVPNLISSLTGADNCGTVSFTQNPAANTAVASSHNGTVMVTITANDGNGNTSNCSVTLTGKDVTTPTVVCKNSTVFVNAAGNYTLLAADVFNATASSDNCSGELTVTNISPATVSCNQANQTIPVTVTVQDAAGNSAICTAQITVQEGTTQPEGWNSNNVGNANGSGGYKPCTGSNGQFTVSATGFSTSSADVLYLVSRQLCGNGEIIAHVASISGGGWAGITLRESLAPGSKLVALKTQGANNIRRMIRTTTNGAVNNLNFLRPHTWLRLVRNGSIFTGYTSANGATWDFAFTATVSMTGCIYAGLFAESINANVTTTAVFDNVQIIGGTSSSLIQASQTPATPSAFSPAVYPNPTTGAVNIDLSGFTNPVGTVRVLDTNGKIVQQHKLDGSPIFRLEVAGADGMYTLSIEVDGQAPVMKRLVIAH